MVKSQESVILIPVLNINVIVDKWRKLYDKVSNHGIPAHITLLYPFRHPSVIDDNALSILSNFFNKVSPFQFSLDKINTFPNVIFLEPNPRELFIDLTKQLADIFPDTLPYDGKFPEINPHLTLAQLSEKDDSQIILQNINNDLAPQLPINVIVKEAWLMEEDDNGEWSIRSKFPFKIIDI